MLPAPFKEIKLLLKLKPNEDEDEMILLKKREALPTLPLRKIKPKFKFKKQANL
jgi:hypothetical protein